MSEEKKRVIVELYANETSVSRAQLVVEVPADCSFDEIDRLDGDSLHSMALANGSEVEWKFEEYEGDFEVLSGIDAGRATNETPDVELTFDEGNLVATAAACQ